MKGEAYNLRINNKINAVRVNKSPVMSLQTILIVAGVLSITGYILFVKNFDIDASTI